MRNIVFNLQLFGEKTEKATSKKREDARKKGQVIFSKDFNMAVTFMITMVTINTLGGYVLERLSNLYVYFSNYSSAVDDMFNPNDLSVLLGRAFTEILMISGPIIITAMVAGVILSYLQVGFLLTGETIKFKLSKLNPINGLKQMFSIRSLVELTKNLLKIAILTYVAYTYLRNKLAVMIDIMSFQPIRIGAIMWEILFNLSLRMSLILIIIGLADYGYKVWQNEKDLKMSKQEIKEEYKMLEGNPQIKAKIKEKQRQLAMSRMMQEVPKADVIITNPTHFAVAIKYDASKYDAPFVLAKGQDLIAKKIRQVAEENKVPIVENKPLARELYASVRIGSRIPENLYHAVAEVLAFVYKIRK